MKGGSNKNQFLCFKCLQVRMGRVLTIDDFPHTHPSGDDMPVNRAVHFGYSLSLATIVERDRRIAELEKVAKVNDVSGWHQCWQDVCAERDELEQRPLEHMLERMESERDTTQPELATARAEIATYESALTLARSEIARLNNIILTAFEEGSRRPQSLIKGGDENANRPETLATLVSQPAHDTSKPSVERQVCQSCNWTNVSLLNVGRPRDGLTEATPFWICHSCIQREHESLASVTADRDQLKAEVEKLRVLVTAKDAIIEQRTAEANILVVLSKQFVRREVLVELRNAAMAYRDSGSGTLQSALTRAEAELTKGNQQ